MTTDERAETQTGGGPADPPGHPLGTPMFSEPADEARSIGDEGLLEILETALADERAAQARYQRGRDRCVDPEACALFDQLLHDEQAHERALLTRHTEVKKRLGLSGTAQRDA